MVKVWYKLTILPRSLMSDFKYNYEARMIESKRIDDTINIKPKSTILELGAGSGHLSHYLTKNGHMVYATNCEDTEVKDCELDPHVTPVYFKYIGKGTPISVLIRYGLYDYVIANSNAMHSESGGEIDNDQDYEYLVTQLLRIVKPGGEIWLGFRPKLQSEYMKQFEVYTDNVLGETVCKIVRHK